ncbi:hypothetical protein XENOCAPTIV_002885, partial [Xenoophorus captivus]
VYEVEEEMRQLLEETEANKRIMEEKIKRLTNEVLEQIRVLKAQISELEFQEKELDDQKAWVEENIKHLNHDPDIHRYPLAPCFTFFFLLNLLMVPVVFPVPPTDDICLMPTPPSTPASLQKFPLLNCAATISNSTSCCSQDSISSDQQMVLLDLDEELTPSSTPGGLQMGED